MTITTYAQLQQEVTRLIDGDDISNSSVVGASLTQIISLGEKRIYREIKSRHNEKAWGLSVTSNAITLPADFQSAGVVHFGKLPLEPVSEKFLLEENSYSPTGDAKYFAKAGNTLIFSPQVTNGTAVQGRYFYSLPALTEATLPSNALFTEAEDLFVYAALTESAPFYGQDARVQLWNAKYSAIRDAINENHHRAAYSAGRMRIRPSTRLMR